LDVRRDKLGRYDSCAEFMRGHFRTDQVNGRLTGDTIAPVCIILDSDALLVGNVFIEQLLQGDFLFGRIGRSSCCSRVGGF